MVADQCADSALDLLAEEPRRRGPDGDAAVQTPLMARYQRLRPDFGSADENAGNVSARQGDWPLVAEPLVWMGFDALARGFSEDAAAYGRAAAVRLRQWGTPWDKSLSMGQWLQLCETLTDTANADELAFITRRIAAAEPVSPWPDYVYLVLDRTGLLPHLNGVEACAPAGKPPAVQAPTLPSRFRKYIADLSAHPQTPHTGMYPGLRSMPWHEPQQFRLAQDLEATADEIAAELCALVRAEFEDEDDAALVPSGRWSYLVLYENGQKNVDRCALCPRTAAVIDANHAVLSRGGVVTVSVLDPATHVAPHVGPTNMRLRCHLGVDIPDGCELSVGGITRTWEEGRCLVFDDSFTHEVWNRSARRRLVLLADMWHPDLGGDEIAALNALQLPTI
jgi:Aspartyl/Asparaginyl beta-hydroxylase